MSNLKPLLEPCPETTANGITKKRWGYSGKILYQDDIDRLTAKGVDWELDIMPDGRLKYPKFRVKRLRNKFESQEKAKANRKEENILLKQKYLDLPEPRPPFFQWAAQEEVFLHYENLKRIAMHSRRDTNRIKALSVLLEHGLAKPKQVMEVANKVEQAEEIPVSRFLEVACELNGINFEELKQFLAAKQQTGTTIQ